MQLGKTLVFGASALLLAFGCDNAPAETPDAAIRFDAQFPDAGRDSGPPPNNVGVACNSAEDCAGGPATTCDEDFGICTTSCAAGQACPEGSACGFGSICLLMCDSFSTSTDQCPQYSGCAAFQTGGRCLPGCEENSECLTGQECAPGTGQLGAGTCFTPTASVGDACTQHDQCTAGGFCVTAAQEWPGGACIGTGCVPSTNTGCQGDAQCLVDDFGDVYCLDGCATSDDCRDGYVCRGTVEFPTRLSCHPAFVDTNLGGACGNTGCQGGTCRSEQFYGYPGGYCVADACDPNATTPCPGDGVCLVESGATLGYCLDGCGTSEDCRVSAGYACADPDPTDASSATACVPACSTDGQCTAQSFNGSTYVCNQGTGLCTQALDATNIGRACPRDRAIPGTTRCSGGVCMDEASTDWPGGMCTQPGCRLSGGDPQEPCPTNTVCVDDREGDADLGVCVPTCGGALPACRTGYVCQTAPDGVTMACLPSCTALACLAGTCNPTSGLCE